MTQSVEARDLRLPTVPHSKPANAFGFRIWASFGFRILDFGFRTCHWLVWCISGSALPSVSRLAVQRPARIQSRQLRAGAQGIRRLLQKKTDDPRLHFNAGAAAYRNRQFDEAAKQFNATLAAPDLKLQAWPITTRARPLSTSASAIPTPRSGTEDWEKALQDYQSTMKLNPQDADAKFNYEFVKQKLEELKQQQQNQPSKIEPSEAAKRAKAEADEAVRRKEYSRRSASWRSNWLKTRLRVLRQFIEG